MDLEEIGWGGVDWMHQAAAAETIPPSHFIISCTRYRGERATCEMGATFNTRSWSDI
jgi:hypothetical protein